MTDIFTKRAVLQHLKRRTNGFLPALSGHRSIRMTSTGAEDHPSAITTGKMRTQQQPGEWRKKQLQNLEQKFSDPQTRIESDEELQPMWKEMESRVTRRRPRTLMQTGGKSGRVNIRETDEDIWAQQGMYEYNDEDDNDLAKKE